MNSKNIIEVTDLQRSLPMGGRELVVLRGISFSVAEGEWVALTGPSGSGKSTLLGLLAGIDRPTRGSVRVDGVEISALPEARLAHFRNEKIGIIFQAFYLIQSMNALENAAAPLYIGPKRRQAHELAERMLTQVGLGGRLDHLPNQLSGGEQQRVAIARALVGGPRVLLADEPTGNLDSATSAQVLQLIREMRRALNLTVVMVTHDPRVALCADRQLHLCDGRLVADPAQRDFGPAMAPALAREQR
ncbi:ABC-type antimicrobial peptide transport system, ATPase component [Longilinea arvoryzae]|uniref:ABC-type antimicrobial peptide transport system, ATPase component n=1 Tax=Longilinea arvoryzae TaxID=360412 RepID=A0A0S7BD56_9CHLR|nr:ABC transporter ATP-binding protein [Longilinea arvoryzae]GAP12660.1 ABC-type antimicrobial peptide transport system, ATPase component [Longilinea arvoryzae]